MGRYLVRWRYLSIIICSLGIVGCSNSLMESMSSNGLSYTNLRPFYNIKEQQSATAIAKTFSPRKQNLRSWKELRPALEATHQYLSKKDLEQVAIAHGDIAITWGQLFNTVNRLETLLDQLDEHPEVLSKDFQWIGLTEDINFLGYYEPMFKASYKPSKEYRYPLYKTPPDLHQLNLGLFKKELVGSHIIYRQTEKGPIPYYSRYEIDDKGVLKGKGLEVAWLKDPLDSYFLHIQGSGLLVFEDGSSIHIGFAGSNGQEYHSLASYLETQGIIPQGNKNIELIRNWIQENPLRMSELLYKNNRYVFFKLYKDGPIGSSGYILSPWISMSVDRSVFPLGAIIAFDLSNNASTNEFTKETCGIGIAQDSGGVKGKKIDIFCGSGQQAYQESISLSGMGNAWILLAK